MAPIPKGGTVAVTASAGFIGGWILLSVARVQPVLRPGFDPRV